MLLPLDVDDWLIPVALALGEADADSSDPQHERGKVIWKAPGYHGDHSG